jgi:hypothetical protein
MGMSTDTIEQRFGASHVGLGDTSIIVWRDPPTMDSWRWYRLKVYQLIRELRPGETSLIVSVVHPTSRPPGSELLDQIGLDMSTWRLRRFVVAIPGDSIFATSVRPLVRMGLFRLGLQTTFTSSISECVQVVRSEARERTPDDRTLREHLGAMHAQLGIAIPTSDAFKAT